MGPQAVVAPKRRRWTHVWLHVPQRSRLRRALFQIHLWAGLILSLHVVVIGLSGSALVFRKELERRFEPRVHRVEPASQYAPWNPVVESIRSNNPGFKVDDVVLPAKPDEPAYVILAPVQKELDRSQMRTYYFNPYTGEVLGKESSLQGPLGWIANLHYFLFAGDPGLIVNGVMAFGFLILCLTGIVLWWPGIKRWTSAIILKSRSTWRRLNWDLHSVAGFWCSAGLAVIAFTGVYFAFPVPIGVVTILATGGNPKQAVALLATPQAPKTSDTHTLPVDDVLRIAKGVLLPDNPPAFLGFPEGPDGVYTVVAYRRDAAPYSQGTTLSIDPHSGVILKKVSSNQYPLGMRITQYFYALHFGSFGGNGAFGVLVKVLWVILGIVSASLGITGVLMYWNRYLCKRFRRPTQIVI